MVRRLIREQKYPVYTLLVQEDEPHGDADPYVHRRTGDEELLNMARKTTVSKRNKKSLAAAQEFEQLGVRIPRDLINRLRIVAATRKAQRATPHSQTEMVTDALTEWLDRNGH